MVNLHWRICRVRGTRVPLSPIVFIFMQFFGKIIPSNRLVPSLRSWRPLWEILDLSVLFILGTIFYIFGILGIKFDDWTVIQFVVSAVTVIGQPV